MLNADPHAPASLTDQRALNAFKIRFDDATREAVIPVPSHDTNGDEAAYSDKSGTYSKCLLQSGYGLVDAAAFTSFRAALGSSTSTGTSPGTGNFKPLPAAGGRKLNGPQAVQNGASPSQPLTGQLRFLHNGRGLAAFSHEDELYQAYLIAYLVLKTINAPPNPGNPYNAYSRQQPFGTFGDPDIVACSPPSRAPRSTRSGIRSGSCICVIVRSPAAAWCICTAPAWAAASRPRRAIPC